MNAETSNDIMESNRTLYGASLRGHSINAAAAAANAVIDGIPSSLDDDFEISLAQITKNYAAAAAAAASNVHPRKPQERYVWEMRTRSPNVTPASTVLNSPDMNTDVQYTLQQHNRHQHHQIRVGRSPVGQFEQHILPQGLTSPGSPTDVGKSGAHCLHEGEIVVFDDIDTNWMNKSVEKTRANLKNVNVNNCKDALPQPQCNNNSSSNEDILKVTKMIGQLPIAEYEGSPRRFGNQNSQQQQLATNAALQPKRPPGFPKRVASAADSKSFQQHKTINNHHHHANQQAAATVANVLQTSYLNNATASDNNPTTTPIFGNLIDMRDYNNEEKSTKPKTPTFDYLYEFSETRKVLEEFFKANPDDERRLADFTESGDETLHDFEKDRHPSKHIEQAYIGQRLARIPKDELYMVHRSPKKQLYENSYGEHHNDIELYIDSNSRSSGDIADTELEANLQRHSRNFTLSPETTDYDSNCGDLDSLSNDINCGTDYGKLYTSMPVLEDGLSSGHASDTENNISSSAGVEKSISNYAMEQNGNEKEQQQMRQQNEYNASLGSQPPPLPPPQEYSMEYDDYKQENEKHIISSFVQQLKNNEINQIIGAVDLLASDNECCNLNSLNNSNELNGMPTADSHYEAVYAAAATAAANVVINSKTSPLSTPLAHRSLRSALKQQQSQTLRETADIQEAMKEIRSALQRAKTQPEKLKFCDEILPPDPESPVWIPRKGANMLIDSNIVHKSPECILSAGEQEEEADTDLETDRLLGQQRLDDHGFYEDKTIWPKTSRIGGMDSNCHSPTTSDMTLLTNNSLNCKPLIYSSATIRQGIGTSLTSNSPEHCKVLDNSEISLISPEKLQYAKSPTGSIKSLKDSANCDKKSKTTRNKEGLLDPAVLIEGVLFRARYLGSTQLVCEGQPTKSTRMMQAEEAVSRIKAPEGESQPSTEVDLFISTEKIMVLNTDLKEIMMDHALRTISYIADIGDLVVLMARRRFVPSDSCTLEADLTEESSCKESKENGNGAGGNKPNRTPKMICHVFESDEAQFIAQSIGQAFQVAYMEFLKANGIEDHSFVKEMDYQEVLNSQEIFGDELEIFAKKELQKEVVVPKGKGEILGVVIVESGWGSMLPTVVIANLMSTGAAARCGQLNIGDQLIAINGMSLVGLPLSTCQSYIRNAKNQTAVKFTVVPCPPVVEVKIKRPNTKYQLGFSVQNGVICSLLRGGIAERGGVRVGHRIIEINNQSVVAVAHEKIVNLLATSVGEILMKTMPTSMFRLLTGQENPIYI